MVHQIPKLRCFLYRLAIVYAQSIEGVKLGMKMYGSWSSADRQCFNYIWVMKKFIFC